MPSHLRLPVTPRLPSARGNCGTPIRGPKMSNGNRTISHSGKHRSSELTTHCLELALHIYALAQKYELRLEALQVAQSILNSV